MTSKILIIDDDPRNIFALSATLAARGYANVSAQSAAEGIQLLDNDEAIGIVLLDMMMPEMDGYETLRKLKSGTRTSAVPVVAVTAQAMSGDKEKCLDAGADDYISKPINVDLLFEKLKQHLNRS